MDTENLALEGMVVKDYHRVYATVDGDINQPRGDSGGC